MVGNNTLAFGETEGSLLLMTKALLSQVVLSMASLRWTAKAAIVAFIVGDDNGVFEVDC